MRPVQTARYDVEVTIDRGACLDRLNYARFIKVRANPWPLDLDAATELANLERAKRYVITVQIVDSRPEGNP